MPCLVHDDLTIWDSLAIGAYLATAACARPPGPSYALAQLSAMKEWSAACARHG